VKVSRLPKTFAKGRPTTSQVREWVQAEALAGAGTVDTVPTPPSYRQPFVVEGASASAGQTSLAVAIGGGTIIVEGEPGIPVPLDMDTSTVAVSWRSDTAPSGDWTATLWRRTAGGAFAAVATFDFQTS